MYWKNTVYFWLAILIVLLGFVFLFKSILMPFVLGGAIAYLLNPSVKSFQRIKIGRSVASLIIVCCFFLVVAAFIALIAPILYSQLADLINEMPGYSRSFQDMVKPHVEHFAQMLNIHGHEDLMSVLQDNSGAATNIAKKVLGSLVDSAAAGGQAVLDMIFIVVSTPILAYFIMKEWENITQWVEDLLPRDKKKVILDLLSQIDQKISGFIRGQISVCLILGVGYAVALSIAGLKYGALIGFMAGVLSIIPMVGSIVGLGVSVLVAYFQSFDLVFVAIIAAIFLIGQIIEGNILSPKIIGDSVGLHPLWIFFALLAGGALFGILGMLLAVPIAATAGVLLAFAITQYKKSSLYKGKSKPPPAKRKKMTAAKQDK